MQMQKKELWTTDCLLLFCFPNVKSLWWLYVLNTSEIQFKQLKEPSSTDRSLIKFPKLRKTVQREKENFKITQLIISSFQLLDATFMTATWWVVWMGFTQNSPSFTKSTDGTVCKPWCVPWYLGHELQQDFDSLPWKTSNPPWKI